MPYTKWFSENYELTSEIRLGVCDFCGKSTKVQCLPAEHNAGEIFETYLCKECLVRLAKEIE